MNHTVNRVVFFQNEEIVTKIPCPEFLPKEGEWLEFSWLDDHYNNEQFWKVEDVKHVFKQVGKQIIEVHMINEV